MHRGAVGTASEGRPAVARRTTARARVSLAGAGDATVTHVDELSEARRADAGVMAMVSWGAAAAGDDDWGWCESSPALPIIHSDAGRHCLVSLRLVVEQPPMPTRHDAPWFPALTTMVAGDVSRARNGWGSS